MQLQTKNQLEDKITIVNRKMKNPKKIILYAEDDPINTLVMKNYLSIYDDLNLLCVENGLEAVKIMDSDSLNIDIIFMDCNMPIMDGYQATQEIRAIYKKKGYDQIPIIAVTANILFSDLENCLAVGMDDYLTKPFKRDDIRKKIDLYLK